MSLNMLQHPWLLVALKGIVQTIDSGVLWKDLNKLLSTSFSKVFENSQFG